MVISVGIVQRDTLFLVIRRTEPNGELEWAFPGGKLHEHEGSAAAAREVHEETGVQCQPVRNLGERFHPSTKVRVHYWLCQYAGGETSGYHSNEVVAARWVTGPEALSLFRTNVFGPVRALLLGQA